MVIFFYLGCIFHCCQHKNLDRTHMHRFRKFCSSHLQPDMYCCRCRDLKVRKILFEFNFDLRFFLKERLYCCRCRDLKVRKILFEFNFDSRFFLKERFKTIHLLYKRKKFRKGREGEMIKFGQTWQSFLNIFPKIKGKKK